MSVPTTETARLRFALQQLGSEHWVQFEQFCNAFLTSEFPNLRPIAGVGDRGRDAVLFGTDTNGVVLQYSIVKDWRTKIRATIARLQELGEPCHLLVYATNRHVGTGVDSLRAELIKQGISLDVRDLEYFASRINRDTATRAASAELAGIVVDPLLAAKDIVVHGDVAQPELRAGLLYLELLGHDVEQSRNLTKLCTEALVLSSLETTTPTARRTRTDILSHVRGVVAGQDPARISAVVNGALDHLKRRKRITYTAADDSFALHYDERKRLISKAAGVAQLRDHVGDAIRTELAESAAQLEVQTTRWDTDEFIVTIELIFEELLSRRGNEFVEAITAGRAGLPRVDLFDLSRTTITQTLGRLPAQSDAQQLFELAAECVDAIIRRPNDVFRVYLRELGDAYTLLAFLRQVPDVQRAVEHIVGHGQLVVDASVLLPCFGELLIPEDERRYANLLSAASRAGLKLQITRGAIEEIDTHLTRSESCYRMQRGRWVGGEPFALRQWRDYGGTGDFEGFVSTFRGTAHPVDDISHFLSSYLEVNRTDLSNDADSFPLDVRGTFAELWRERKRVRPGQDEEDVDVLLRHDVEMYLGVLGRRRRAERGLFGFTDWWLTADGSAFSIGHAARRAGIHLGSSPVMHPEFLGSVLTVGTANRDKLSHVRRLLPVALNIQHQGWGVPELSDLATRIRQANSGDPEWVIRRKIRDSADELRANGRWRVVPVSGEDTLVAEEAQNT